MTMTNDKDNTQIASDTFISLSELCALCHIELVVVEEYVTNDILIPHTQEDETWVFDLNQLERMRRALRLQKDFDLSLSGIALVLHLLDEIKALREEVALLEKHTLK